MLYPEDDFVIPGGGHEILLLNFTSLGRGLGETPSISYRDPVISDSYGNKIMIVGDLGMPGEYRLYHAYPNPFNPATVIGYDLPEAGLVQITIYDITGREVTNPVNSVEDAGYHQIRWDASSYSSGAYFVKMVSGDFTRTQKVMLVK